MNFMNLSGKRTRIGRNSGECFRLYYAKPPKRKAILVNFQVPGQRTPVFKKGFFCPFLCENSKGGDFFVGTVETYTSI